MTKFNLYVYGKQASGYHLLTNDRLYVIVTPTRFNLPTVLQIITSLVINYRL